MNNTFELVIDPANGQQVYESKEHKLQVAFSDLEEELNWNYAKAACSAQGEGCSYTPHCAISGFSCRETQYAISA
jgi:hypothetical protein